MLNGNPQNSGNRILAMPTYPGYTQEAGSPFDPPNTLDSNTAQFIGAPGGPQYPIIEGGDEYGVSL